jgi:DNA-binding beta-propeller fold protein YncE
MKRTIVLALAACAALGAGASAPGWLPTAWHLSAPTGAVATTGVMPQGLAISPDGTTIAVVESGVNPPSLGLLAASDLHEIRQVPLRDAFGTPVWSSDRTVLVPGATTNAVLAVDAPSGRVSSVPAGDYVSAVAVRADGSIDAANDLADTLDRVRYESQPQTFKTGSHPAAIANHGATTYVANRGESTLTMLPAGETIAVDLHPAALALSRDGTKLYVACTDADTIDVVSTQSNTVVARIDVGLPQGRGASPNALALAADGTLYATLGAENAVAQIRNDRVVARIGAGWYPTGVAVRGDDIYVSNGKGEGSRPNPDFRPEHHRDPEYVASALVGSVRKISRVSFTADSTASVIANMPQPLATPAQTIVHANGPIKHVIYIIKENRTYDQVLGDVAGADGDASLAYFGAKVTPNDHAMRRSALTDTTGRRLHSPTIISNDIGPKITAAGASSTTSKTGRSHPRPVRDIFGTMRTRTAYRCAITAST